MHIRRISCLRDLRAMLACYQVLVLWKWDRDRRTNRSSPSKVCPDGPSKRALGTSCTERLGNASLHQPAAEAFPVLPQRWTVNGILEFWAQPVRQAGTASCVREGEGEGFQNRRRREANGIRSQGCKRARNE